jgi:hypothetical protein
MATGNENDIQTAAHLIDQKLSAYRIRSIVRPTLVAQERTIADLQQVKADIDEILHLLGAS